MKITFSNLGSIKKTTLDLRPLTVIIGPNNSNKTYIAYSIYGILQHLRTTATDDFMDSLGYDYQNERGSKDVNKLYEFNNSETYLLKINNNFFKLFYKDCLELTSEFKRRLEVFFQDSSGKLFKETNFEVKFTKDEIKAGLKKFVANTHPGFGESFQSFLEKNNLRIEHQRNFLAKYISPLHSLSLKIGFGLKEGLFTNPFVLPAERNALIISYKILETKRYDLLKESDRESIRQQKLSFEESGFSRRKNIRYPQPIEDFLKFLTDLELENRLEKGNLAEFANIIEEKLQQNNKTEYVPNKLGDGKEIKVNVIEGLDIDLYNASSSIKQLAPLLLYLRYRAKENDLLIIDEPEMNLHPESQAKFLEVLGMLVNAGVNVLLTTHSPYFLSHLNNLVSGKTGDEKTLKEQAKSLYLKDERAFLALDDVSAYEMKNNKLVSLKDKDYGIRWDTLSDVSADIQQKFFEIYEKGEQPADGEEE